MRDIFDGVTKAAHATFDLSFDTGHPMLVNNPELTAQLVPTLARLVGADKIHEAPPITGAEDFSYFANVVPGFYFQLGVVPEGKVSGGHHTPTFYAADEHRADRDAADDDAGRGLPRGRGTLMPALVECVPNFSEGRDRSVIDAISRAISGVSGVRLLDVDAGADTNRTVYTFVGTPDAVSEAAFRGAVAASGLIDMSKHEGAHPRMGALDVCPIVPISGVTMDQCVEVARALGRRLAESLALPVYFYEYAAMRPERRNLADIRAGEYEGLRQKLARSRLGARCGACRLQRAARRHRRRRARIPHRLQRQRQHARPEAGQRSRAQHPRSGTPEARCEGPGRHRRRRPRASRAGPTQGREGDRLVHRAIPPGPGVDQSPELPDDAAARSVRNDA